MKIARSSFKHIALASLFVIAAVNAQAATTNLAASPLVSSAPLPVKPNVFLMIDDSGSMGWDYMPDEAGNFPEYGYDSSQCNGVYYDPATNYFPPVDYTGTSYPNSTFTGAWNDGYNTAGGTTNLSSGFSSGASATGAAFYYKYSGMQTTEALKTYYNTSSTFFKECNSSVGLAPGNAVFTKITVSATSGPGATDERTNFANWYSYYRTRINMMKTASGLAFKPLNTNYRVGLGTMNNNGGSMFLNPDTFDPGSPASSTSQRALWYKMLYAVTPSNSTPLLGALAQVGLMYAYKLPGNSLNGVTAKDPIQYSCQQNFVILSTDGFWNSQSGNVQLDNATSVGQQDGTEQRPMYDGASATTTTKTPTTTIVRQQSVQATTTTTPWTRTNKTIGASCNATVVTPPANASSTLLSDNNRSIALGLASSNPDSNKCVSVGTGNAWLCKGGNNFGSPAVSNTSVTDSKGKTWYLVSSGAGNIGCVDDNTSFGNNYSSSKGACPATSASVTGNNVTTQLQTYNQIVTGTTTTTTDNTTVVTTTVVSTNGQAQSSTSTTSGPTSSAVSTTTAVVSDTGAPTGTTTWTTTTSSVCTAPPLPAAGTSTPVSGTPSVVGTGSATVSTLSTNTTVGTPTVTNASSGGTSNTLADVAEYYYITDLRTAALGNNLSAATGFVGTDVSTNNVPNTGLDAASWQHMTLFTLGLGARGSMVFSPTYMTDKSGDFFSVANGVLANPSSGICSWQSAGSVCNWPTPVSGTQTTIDDLWHAAVNGRGTYFSATNPAMLSMGLNNALNGVTARTGTSAAATTSNPNITSGDNFVFSSTFVTVDWYGELVRQQIDLTTGATLPAIDWAAQAQLDAKPWSTRTIYGYSATAANKLQLFNTTNYGANVWFNVPNISTLSQFCAAGPTCLTGTQQTAAAGVNLVKFLIGDRSLEGFPTISGMMYRARKHVLGDIVNAEAVYVKSSVHSYADPGYSAFATANNSRQGMVYAAGNDGMLHAFYSANGTGINGGDEAWAYIPTMIMPGLFHLADFNYSSAHQYFVDGTPVQGDVSIGGVWKTILVGGLNGGGRGYYALDVTDPANPKALWEFTNTNLGLTYGNPEIAKLANGTWVVLIASGYNNVSPGDGVGHLFVLNAYTGALLQDISNGVGSTTTPSGLSRIIAQVVNPATDATILQVYGGDLLGNVWRFDVNGNVGAPGVDAQLLATLKGPTGLPQPITIKPQVGIISGSTVVFVGTGRYLGNPDLTNIEPQSFYGIKDPLSTGTTPSVAIYSNPRTYAPNTFVQQTQTTTTCPAGSPTSVCLAGQIVRTSSSNPVSWTTNSGWYIDLPDSGERATTDPTLQLGTLGFTSNVPSVSSCTVSGYSYSYFLNYSTGAPVTITTGIAGVSAVKLGNAMATRPVYVRLPNNTVVQLIRLSDGSTMTTHVPIGGGASATRRTSWRELITQ